MTTMPSWTPRTTASSPRRNLRTFPTFENRRAGPSFDRAPPPRTTTLLIYLGVVGPVGVGHGADTRIPSPNEWPRAPARRPERGLSDFASAPNKYTSEATT